MREFSDDNVMMLAAATAFYAILSLAPMIVLLLWIGGLLGDRTQQQLVEWVTHSIGPKSGDAVDAIVENAADNPVAGTVAGAVSIASVLLAASGLFAQLQRAMNIIWDVEATRQGAHGMLLQRLSALGVMLLLAVVLIASVVVSGVLLGMVRSAGADLPGSDWLWWGLNLAASILLHAVLFAAVFKILPDVQITWRHTWLGAFLAAILFTVGKLLMGLYFGNSTRWTAYGAAGSMLMLLVWVYYSSIIFFLCAEWTQVWARRQGEPIRPRRNAVAGHRKSRSGT